MGNKSKAKYHLIEVEKAAGAIKKNEDRDTFYQDLKTDPWGEIKPEYDG